MDRVHSQVTFTPFVLFYWESLWEIEGVNVNTKFLSRSDVCSLRKDFLDQEKEKRRKEKDDEDDQEKPTSDPSLL